MKTLLVQSLDHVSYPPPSRRGENKNQDTNTIMLASFAVNF